MTDDLTPREQEILLALAAMPYRSQPQIAQDLGISPRTARSHISTILSKTGAPDQRALVLAVLYERMAHQEITQLSRAGRRLAVITVTPITPVAVDCAIEMLAQGRTLYVLSTDVAAVLDGLEEAR